MIRAQSILALRELLQDGRISTVRTQGTSMHPSLRAGDRVQLQAVRPEQVRLGDLIAFLQDGKLVVHRFAGRKQRADACWLRQKGDNLRGFGLVHPDHLIGRVIRVETAAGARSLQSGGGLWQSRILGCRAWLHCQAWAAARGMARLLGWPGRQR